MTDARVEAARIKVIKGGKAKVAIAALRGD